MTTGSVRAGLALAALMLGALLLAWSNRFVQDDAFIAFQYARSLVDGSGLTWFGTRVEGYSQFLWVLWIALGIWIGYGPVTWAWISGLAAFALAIGVLARLCTRVTSHLPVRAFVLLAFVTNYSVSAYATGGLDTMLSAVMLTAAVYLVTRFQSAPSVPGATQISIVFALAFLNRMDAAVPLLALAPFLARAVLRVESARRAAHLLALAGPFLAFVAPWLAWKWWYYGALLPNTALVKLEAELDVWAAGALYVARFSHAYRVWACVLLMALAHVACALRYGRTRPSVRTPGAPAPAIVALLAWLGYVIAVGGDFMEFRMMVIAAPLMFLMLGAAVPAPLPPAVRASLLGATLMILAGSSYHHATSFRGITDDKRLDSIDALGTFYGLYRDGDWSRVGTALKHELGGFDVVIAVSASGAIPYFSELCSVDMLGLNDRRIAGEGNRAGPEYLRPGHRIVATWQQLREAGVHLIVGHPQVVPPGVLRSPGSLLFCKDLLEAFSFLHRQPLREGTFVSMPIDGAASLVMLYFQPHPLIDSKLRHGDWEARFVLATE